MSFDVVIVGGGPGGLTAALNLGRARRRVLLCDAGPRRNAAAAEIHGFVTRDGTPPEEFRRIARAQLAPYTSVTVRDSSVAAIAGERGAFAVTLASGEVMTARRVLLCTGMIDVLPALDGFAELWGHAIFICPYCHAWEVQDRSFGVLAGDVQTLELAVLLRAWTDRVVAFTDGLVVPPEVRERLTQAGVRIEERGVARLFADGRRLVAVQLADGERVAIEILFTRPPQRQVALVQALGLALDDAGYVRVEHGQTSVPGIYAGGDLVTPMQSATIAAASAMQAAAMLNHELSGELARASAH